MSLFDYFTNWFSFSTANEITGCVLVSSSINEPFLVKENVTLLPVADILLKVISHIAIWQNSLEEPKDATPFITITPLLRNSSLLKEESISSFFQFFSHFRSFHITIYRLLSFCLRECCQHNHLQHTLSQILSTFREDMKLTSIMVEILSSVLAFEAQIKAGMWRRNGPSMEDQVLNYADPPFCKTFKDLDRYLLQFVAIGCDSTLFIHILSSKFGLTEIIKEIVFSPLIAEFDPTSMLCMESLLLNIINIVSDLPLPLDTSSFSSLPRQVLILRREVIHRLGQSAATYTEISEYMVGFKDSESFLQTHLDTILAEIADKRIGRNELEAATFVLKPQMWSEFDPTFPHLSSASHQAASESRLNTHINNSSHSKEKLALIGAPYVAAFLPSHPFYCPVREKLLFHFLLMSLLRGLFLRYAASVCTNLSVYVTTLAATSSSSSLCSENLFLRALHMLTLILHECEKETKESSPLRLQLGHHMVVLSEGFCNISWLTAICDIYGAISNKDKMHQWLLWILLRLETLPDCRDTIGKHLAGGREEVMLKEKEMRKKRARERALQKIQISKDRFISQVNHTSISSSTYIYCCS